MRSYIDPITDPRPAERRLWEERRRFQTLLECAPFGMMVIDQDGTFNYINPKFREMFGYDLKDVPDGKTWFRRAYPDPNYRQDVISKWKKDLESLGIGETRERTLRVKCKDGKEKIIHFIIVQLETGENLVTCEDVNEHKLAELKLEEREEKYRLVVENSNEVILVVQNGWMKFLNQRTVETLGYSYEELISRPIGDLIYPEDRHEVLGYHQKKLKGERVPPSHVLRMVDREGRIRWFEMNTVAITWEGRPATLNFLSDITEKKQAEKQMGELQSQFLQYQKMEAIGRLAGGVAHDFNNILTVIKGYCQLSLLDLGKDDPVRGNVEAILKSTERASDLTRQLLAFSRRQIMDMKVFDLNILLQDLNKMLRRVIGEDIELVTVLGDPLGNVRADPGQIEQVMLNLAVNARDAMPSGGKLYIETANIELGETHARSHVDIVPGHYVMLSVSDTGVGMPPEVKERIFEPFFTTKEKGKGTGLGLSTVYGIVKQSGGDILVHSELGKGTTFKIYLPQVEEPLDQMRETAVEEELPSGNETILVVEDEEEVRKLSVKVLGRQGYDALEASNGGEALLICEQWREPIHLILIDVVMPQMSGPQLIDRLQKVRQGFKVLYMSGYSDDAIAHHGILKGGVSYIQKPFSADQLARKVREVLDQFK